MLPEVVEFVRSTVAEAQADSVCWAIDKVVPRRAEHRVLLGAVRKLALEIAGAEDRTLPVAEPAPWRRPSLAVCSECYAVG
jgi:hypothetical protein